LKYTLFEVGSLLLISEISKTGILMDLREKKEFDREIGIRQRIHRDFNKVRQDFSSLKEYYDYLEEVEDISNKKSFIVTFFFFK